MSAIRMTHPVHGATHVYDLGDQRRHEGYGWSVEKPAEAKPERVVGADIDGDGKIDVVFARKPGRPRKV